MSQDGVGNQQAQYSSIHSFIYSSIHLFIYSSILLFFYSSIHPSESIHPPIHPYPSPSPILSLPILLSTLTISLTFCIIDTHTRVNVFEWKIVIHSDSLSPLWSSLKKTQQHNIPHTHIHTLPHTLPQTYIHTYTHIHTYIHTYVHTHTSLTCIFQSNPLIP
ncbi:hypothetical protein DID88_001102 [Monilinia fructigena]|uniref:Uncharacterized protein n=1 Tax=Monilinia fructigena TaxID=38457 RepID=A0A395IZ48_9HELO|nr:hypothetical protein DID88_001102 [Monilinia fructigena]